MDRVVSARVTGEVFVRPADFDLSSAWERVVSVVERRRSTVSAVVSVEPRYVFVLRDQFGRHCEVLGEVEGRVRLRLSATTALMIAQVLAGWGALVEVVESDGVRAELARLGAELVARYSPVS